MNASTNANIDDIPVCAIAAGVYPIGDHTSEVSRPAHTVHLASFAIAVHCVTNQQFTAFIADGGYFDNRYWTAMGWRWQRVQQKNEPAFWRDPRFNQPDQPVVGVCWYEAMAFARWLREQTKRAWRLPTEVEWEAAARGAGNTAPLIDLSRLNSAELGLGHPWAVQHGAVSWCGAVNLLGNVWEWTSSRWGRNWQTMDYGYPYSLADDRESPDDSHARVMRGGSWFDAATEAQPTTRARYLPGSRASNIGFRLAHNGA